MTESPVDAWIRQFVEAAPPLTPETRAHLAVLLRPRRTGDVSD